MSYVTLSQLCISFQARESFQETAEFKFSNPTQLTKTLRCLTDQNFPNDSKTYSEVFKNDAYIL